MLAVDISDQCYHSDGEYHSDTNGNDETDRQWEDGGCGGSRLGGDWQQRWPRGCHWRGGRGSRGQAGDCH